MLTQLRAVIAALSLLLIAACGGGGGGSPVTVGGTVTGLVGKLVLQNNAGDNLSVTANGTFTFATPLNEGAAYAITVLTQPPGPTCVVSNDTGTATANVTSVLVTCTTDPATVFVPMSASPVTGSAVPGTSGLFVIASKSPGDPPIQITQESSVFLGLQAQYTLSPQGKARAVGPGTLMYTTLNSSGGDHVWSLNLAGTSTLVPTQLSNLTIPNHTQLIPGGGGATASVQYCQSQVIPKNLADPSSAFLILTLPNDTTLLCLPTAAAFKWLLIHSGDGPATDPVNLPALRGSILPLYRPDGVLAGLVAMDASNNLNFYPDETFANPRLLLANVAYFAPLQEASAGAISRISSDPTYSFLEVTPANSNSGLRSVYRVDSSGSISADLYDILSEFRNAVVDSGNLYLTTLSEPPPWYSESVRRIPSDGGAVQLLGSASADQGQ
jgi:hypothetical protein